jgi:hypothetical protein
MAARRLVGSLEDYRKRVLPQPRTATPGWQRGASEVKFCRWSQEKKNGLLITTNTAFDKSSKSGGTRAFTLTLELTPAKAVPEPLEPGLAGESHQ